MIWSARVLKSHLNSTSAENNGRWLPVRPKTVSGWLGLKERIKGAWLVLTNKADAVTWK